MKINQKNIWIIMISACLIGFIYNYLNPNGIPLIKKERVLDFEDENPQLNSQSSEVGNPNDTSPEENHTDQIRKDIQESKPGNIEFSEPKAIKLTRAYELFNQEVIFIDARTKEEFAEGHIKGALNIPFYESEKYENVLAKIGKSQVIVTYCSGADCDLSIMLGDELFEKGYKRIYVFYGGWNDWIKADYPVSK